ncbi:NU6M oxidoreductase, partial [Eudromia elegans]|nr:NU6M oxidoreductase [Eudromia elegans]
ILHFFLDVCFLLEALAVTCNLSPYYDMLDLVVRSVVGCGWLVSLRASFISLVLFLANLGGMLGGVVFVYSVSLAAD